MSGQFCTPAMFQPYLSFYPHIPNIFLRGHVNISRCLLAKCNGKQFRQHRQSRQPKEDNSKQSDHTENLDTTDNWEATDIRQSSFQLGQYSRVAKILQSKTLKPNFTQIEQKGKLQRTNVDNFNKFGQLICQHLS